MSANAPHTIHRTAKVRWPGGVPVIFLPGIILPAALRYAPLLRELGDAARAMPKELEVYATATVPEQYSIDCEVDGISRAADAVGFDRFHLYGHSAGGACALAYVAAHPERVLSLALDEPASDFSPEDQSELQRDLDDVAELSAGERFAAFLKQNLAPDCEPPSPPAGPQPEWMAHRPAGIDAFIKALLRYRLPLDRLRTFGQPVYYSYGSLSHPRWFARRDRLDSIFSDFTSDRYDGCHHLETSHQRAPERVASALRQLWSRTE